MRHTQPLTNVDESYFLCFTVLALLKSSWLILFNMFGIFFFAFWGFLLLQVGSGKQLQFLFDKHIHIHQPSSTSHPLHPVQLLVVFQTSWGKKANLPCLHDFFKKHNKRNSLWRYFSQRLSGGRILNPYTLSALTQRHNTGLVHKHKQAVNTFKARLLKHTECMSAT